MRSDFTIRDGHVACKAGRTATHHGPHRCGPVLRNWRGKAFIPTWAALYEKYFDAEKYDTPQASSIGHNLISSTASARSPAAQGQSHGLLHRREDPRIPSGRIRRYTLWTPRRHPEKSSRVGGGPSSSKKPHTTVVVDEVSCARVRRSSPVPILRRRPIKSPRRLHPPRN